MTLQPITETCTPRKDVLEGQLSDLMFAANLDKIVREPESYPVYGDPEQFFGITHPTAGLKRLLSRTFGRLSGARVEGAEHGVIRSQTTFGGGKTHGLIAVYHIAKGARPPALDDFIAAELLPDDCQVAAVVGDALDPVAGVVADGERTYTLWGEIAAQLGRFDVMRANDAERTAPGSGTWSEVVGTRPTVVIIDEIAGHLRQLASSGSEEVRRQAAAVPAALKSLFELAASIPNLVVIVTLATHADAYGKETNDIEDLLNETEGAFQSAMVDAKSVLARTESVIKPAEDNEIAQILKTRLFESIDATSASSASAAYRSFYEELVEKGVSLPGGADQPTAYSEQVEASYPFHPELIRVLDKRLGTIPNFQRARGALKLLAEVIVGIWNSGVLTEVINVADIDLAADPVLTHLTVGLGRDEYENVAKVDIVGSSSHAGEIDHQRFPQTHYAARAATTVFIHSLELVATAGATRSDYLIGTLRADDEPAVIEEALAALAERAWHLDYDGARYRFLTEPNANAIVAEEARNVQNSAVAQELEDRIRRAFPDDGPVKTRFNPTGPVDVPNEARLQLILCHYDDEAVTSRNAATPPDRIVDIRDKAGASGFRTYRNGVVFLIADGDQVANLKDRIRFSIATDRIRNDLERLNQFPPEVRKKITALADEASLNTLVALARCYSHLYYPTQDAQHSHLRHYEIPPKDKGAVPDKLTKTVVQALRDEGKIRDTKPATDYLRQKAWQPKDAGEILVSGIADYFWQDHSMALILDPNLLKESLRDGVANGTWVYFDPDREQAWTAGDAAPPVALDGGALLYTLEEAEKKSLLRKPVRIDDIVGAVHEKVAGPELREALESSLGYEPTKKEIVQTLARAVSGASPSLVVVVGEPGTDSKPATQAQLEKAGFDTLYILTPAAATEIGIDLSSGPGPGKPRPIEGKGLAGVALGQVASKVEDTPNSPGIAVLQITATVDPGEGVKDLRALGMAIPMLPKFEISVVVDVDLEFANLTEGVEIKLSGPSSAYQAVEDAVLALGKAASDATGKIRLELRPMSPISVPGPEFDQIHKALTSVDPGEITVRAELA